METHHKYYVPEANSQFEMHFRMDTETIKSGQPVRLYFKPLRVNRPDSIVALRPLHEKKIHLIIISKDLSYFFHGHPKLINGEYVVEHTFPLGGSYILFQDYMPKGSPQQLDKQEIYVAGDKGSIALADSAVNFWKGDEYEVELVPDAPKIKVNTAVMLKAVVSKNGEDVTDLEKYLGALAHVVIINSDALDYLHVHAMETTTNGPDILLHTRFSRSGFYKVFLEFKHKGNVRLANFVLAAGEVQ